MAHVHKVARYTQLLRANPTRPAPALRAADITPQSMKLWKERTRAFDDAKVALKLATPEQIDRENSAFRLDPASSRIVKYASYA